MIKQTPGKIFLADQGALSETIPFRRFSFFGDGEAVSLAKDSFGRLYGFNEVIMAGAGKL